MIKRNILVLLLLSIFVLFIVSCDVPNDSLDFSKFGSSAREEAEKEESSPFYDNEYKPDSSSIPSEDLTEKEEKASDEKTEDEEKNSQESGDFGMNDNLFMMRAVIEKIEDKITVNVYEAEYADGIYLIIYGDSTVFLNADGGLISLCDLKVGDKIEITYNGQVMMSYPPQVAAIKIKKL